MVFWRKKAGEEDESKAAEAPQPAAEPRRTTPEPPAAAPKSAQPTPNQAQPNGADAKAAPAAAAQAQSQTKSQPVAPNEEQIRVLGEVVSLMVADQRFANLKLPDLRWLVGPSIAARQAVVARAKISKEGQEGVTPIAAALWAQVSPEVDQRLSELARDGKPLQLKPEEWRSGDKIWVIVTMGAAPARAQILKHLQDNVFRGREWKQFERAQT